MRVYYHNVTQDILNESDLDEFLEMYEPGDACYKSEAGNACIERIPDMVMEQLVQLEEDQAHVPGGALLQYPNTLTIRLNKQ